MILSKGSVLLWHVLLRNAMLMVLSTQYPVVNMLQENIAARRYVVLRSIIFKGL